MMSLQKVEILRQAIIVAFANVPRPDLNEIHWLGCCGEHAEFFTRYRPITYRQFKEELLTNAFDPFEFFALHPMAYHYFVPGLLLALLEFPSLKKDWMYNLCPAKPRAARFTSDYLPFFTKEQRAVITQFLQFISNEFESEYAFRDADLDRAINFWRSAAEL